MDEKFAEYQRSLGMSDTLQGRVSEILDSFRKMCG